MKAHRLSVLPTVLAPFLITARSISITVDQLNRLKSYFK